MAATLLALTMVVFSLSRAVGDPRLLYLDEYTTKKDWDAMGRQMGLERPLVVQYSSWMGQLLRGNLGDSLREARPVVSAISERIWPTLQLAGLGWFLTVAFGVPLGVLAASTRGSMWDYLSRVFTTVGQSVPSFWLGIMLILLFSVTLHWLPSGRRGGWQHYVLPIAVLGPLTAAGTLRLTRASMLNILDSEYIKLARAKGVNRFVVIWKHGFRNALIAPLTYSALVLASLLTGTVLVETVFAWPGLGRLAISAVNENDFPLLTGIVLFIALIYLAVNFLTDVAYAVIDPRIRYQ